MIQQASSHMANESVDHGVIMAGHVPSLYAKTQLGSVQTIRARCLDKNIIPLPSADILIIDEGHNGGSKTYERIYEQYPKAIIIGFTATPVSKNGKGLGHFYDHLILGPSVRELMDQGFLAEASYMVPNVPDLAGISVRGGDYVEEQLGKLMNDAVLVGDIVEHWKKYAPDRKTIAFACNVAHSRAIVASFLAEGIPAAHIDGKTPQDERDEIIRDYSNGVYKVLSNCAVFVEGFDLPAVDAVILAKPTKSLKIYLQSAGRGLRPKENGGYCLILDHSGSVLRHGALDMPHDWSLDERTSIEERDYENQEPREKKEFACANCGNIFSGQPVCPKCGTPLAPNVKDVDTQRGELVEFKPKKKEEKHPPEMRREWYGMFLMHAAEKKYKDSWAAWKYKDKFGEWPKSTYTKGLITRTPDFMGYIQHLNIKNAYKRKAK